MKIMKEQEIPIDTPLSYEKLLKLVQDQKLFMTLYTLEIGQNFIEKLKEVWSGSGTSTSSLSSHMKTTATSCRTAIIPKEDADVNLSDYAEDMAEQLNKLLGSTSSVSDGGGISSYISKQTCDN